MSDRSHLRIKRQPDTRRYKYAKVVVGGEFKLPRRDRLEHAKKLTGDLLKASAQGQEIRREQGLLGQTKAFVYTFRSEPDHDLLLKSLERSQNDIEIQGVHLEGNVQVATVRVPDGKLNAFFRLVKAYQTKVSKSGKFSNQKLIESISSISLTAVQDLWQDPTPFPKPEDAVWWEIWIRSATGGATVAFNRFRELLNAVGVRSAEQFIAFPERVVLLGFGSPKKLSSSLDVLAEIAELRRAKDLSSEYLLEPPRMQREYIKAAEEIIVAPSPEAPAVCLLDTGVNRGHPLLEVALDESDAQALRTEWGTSDSDRDQHGTTMAGVALYGCLTELFSSVGPYMLRHRLESVKLLPPRGANDPELYGSLTQEAVAIAEIQAPQRNRAVCLTITSDAEDKALPSSWSAAIDQMCAGQLDQTRRLVFIAAGNVRHEMDEDAYRYHEWNCTQAPLEDPGQAWNALTVGAITEKVFITDPFFEGWTPIATASGDLCPRSRTSLAWPEIYHSGWPLKPDIVMEGGNYAESNEGRSAVDDLSILTTVMKIDGGRLTTTRDTSPATASAARLAAILWSYYPNLRPETVRGLLVHSARWTEAMKHRFPGDAKSNVQKCLRCYGYGIPRLGNVLWSSERAATLIYEGDLQPYVMVEGKVETNEMHIHQLPWPREVLLGLGDTRLRMRVTLSYFVEPSPGRIGWQKQHRYQSHGLRFDVIRPLEDEAQFRQRVSKAEWDNPEERPKNVGETRQWVVGENGRTHGSLHCDWWEGTAAELADSNRLAIYPVTGWWRERDHLERYSSRARYSLIISLETEEESIDLYTAIEAETSVGTEIEVVVS